jgi:CubicO group peptidase (beta-lactamase class C family)
LLVSALSPLAYQPGARLHYGHSTDVLGFLIDRVLEPLGMVDTDFWVPPAKRHRLASLYSYNAEAEMLAKINWHLFDAPPSYTPGGGGLISTGGDYHRFARMLLQDGRFDGMRLLRPETVRLMRTNRLTPAQRAVPFAGMPLWRNSGFGLGLSLCERAADNPYTCGAKGSMTWPGIFGTWWQANPVNDLVMIYLVQHQVPVSAGLGATVATRRGAAGRRALPIYQQDTYAALRRA